jgi:hypothetical protein
VGPLARERDQLAEVLPVAARLSAALLSATRLSAALLTTLSWIPVLLAGFGAALLGAIGPWLIRLSPAFLALAGVRSLRVARILTLVLVHVFSCAESAPTSEVMQVRHH